MPAVAASNLPSSPSQLFSRASALGLVRSARRSPAAALPPTAVTLRDGSRVLVATRAETGEDGRDHVAFVASTPDGREVGTAHFARSAEEPASADVNVVVDEAFRKRGLGSYLVGFLRAAAVDVGVTTFRASVPPGDVAGRKLLARVGEGPLGVEDRPHGVRVRLAS